MTKPKKKNNNGPLILIIAGLILIVGVVLFQVATSAPTSQASSTPVNASIPYANVNRVSPSDTKAALDQKNAVVVDVRDAEYYNTSHVLGSINIPLGDIQARLRELNPNQWIILYCT